MFDRVAAITFFLHTNRPVRVRAVLLKRHVLKATKEAHHKHHKHHQKVPQHVPSHHNNQSPGHQTPAPTHHGGYNPGLQNGFG